MDYIEILKKNGILKVINEPCDIDLEIAHLSYIEVKKDDSKALLFTNPTDKNGKKYPPVLTNIFGSFKALELILGNPDEIAKEIEALLKPKKPKNFKEKFEFFSTLLNLKSVFPKKIKKGVSQELKFIGSEVDLFNLPALKTWEKDGGAFITMGQVYTQSLDGNLQNLGMYRLQVYDKNHLGMHWQIHKDGADFFNEYKKAGLKMPVSVAIGGDPLYIWCGQAPLPKGVFELLLYGFIRKSPAKLVKSLTNEIYIPHDADFVIEGFVDTQNLALEGPFGDHTGFYTPIEPFPVMEVSAITSKKEPIFHATVVGKPPLEDKFMGYATERIFLPLLKTTAPDLIDYKMPENGVFHNLILAKFHSKYPAHAQQLMHAFWGVGQMSFVKHALFFDELAPNLNDFTALCKYALNRLGEKSLIFSSGVCDQLDHASPNSCFGGKLGIDFSSDNSSDENLDILSDTNLLEKFQKVSPKITRLKQHFLDTKNPITLINIEKDRKISDFIKNFIEFKENFKVVFFLDSKIDLNNFYMLTWRIVNNIDANRDIFVKNGRIFIDATRKFEWEGYLREWPDETNCNKFVIDKLIKKGLVENNESFFKKFEILQN